MSERWSLKRTAQCNGCPWRVEADPREIPNGYCETKHRALSRTIATDPLTSAMQAMTGQPLHVFACHETQDAHCIGWLMNQLGPGNNIALRMDVRHCDNIHKVRLKGEQHARFEDTLPED